MGCVRALACSKGDSRDRLIWVESGQLLSAVEPFRELAGLFEAYILSTAPWDNPTAWSDKPLWVRKYLCEIARQRLILTHHKNLNRGDFLIDDRTRHDVDLFEGEHIHFGSERFPDWPAVMTYLRVRT